MSNQPIKGIWLGDAIPDDYRPKLSENERSEILTDIQNVSYIFFNFICFIYILFIEAEYCP